MTDFDLTQLRLHNQAIAPADLATPGDVVKRLGAIQAQDYLGAGVAAENGNRAIYRTSH